MRYNSGSTHVNSGISVATNTWVNITAVYDMSISQVTIYKDGVALYTGGITAMDISSNFLAIGQFPFDIAGSSTRYFAGKVDNVKAYSETLNSSEVTENLTGTVSGKNLIANFDFEGNASTWKTNKADVGDTIVVVGATQQNGQTTTLKVDSDIQQKGNGTGTDGSGVNDDTLEFGEDGTAGKPNITSIDTPTAKNYNTGEDLTFKVHYDKITTVSGTPRIALNVGGSTKYATYVSGAGTDTLIFTYQLDSTVDSDGIGFSGTSIDLNSGSIGEIEYIDGAVDTATTGNAFGTGYRYGSYLAPDAFDDNTVTRSIINVGGTIGQNYGTPKIISKYTILGYSSIASTTMPRDWTFQGSNNNSTWTTLDTQSGITWSDNQLRTFSSGNTTAYQYYRLYITANGGHSDMNLPEIQFFENILDNDLRSDIDLRANGADIATLTGVITNTLQTISNLPSVNHDVVLSSDGTTDITVTGQTGTKNIRLRNASDKCIAEFDYDFDTGTHDFSSFTAERNDTNSSAFVHGLIGHTGVGNTYKMCTNKDPNHDTIRICSGKITEGCTSSDDWTFTADEAGVITLNTDLHSSNPIDPNYFDTSGITVTVTGGEWKINGVTGTSAQGENSSAGGASGAVVIEFDITQDIPADGVIRLDVPDDFTMDDIADMKLNPDLVSLTDEGTDIDVSTEITSAVLSGNVITITLNTGTAIAAGNTVSIGFSDQVFDQNPATAGEYYIGWVTQNKGEGGQTGTPIEQGNVVMKIENEVKITASVLEAMILTLEETAVNLVVNPSVNSGVDQTQKSTLKISTNSPTYAIQAKLENSEGNDSGLHYFDGATHYYISNGWDVTDGPENDGENVFGYNTSAVGEATTNFSSAVNDVFTNQTGLNANITHNIFYDLNVDFLSPAGVYEGIITYTAVPSF